MFVKRTLANYMLCIKSSYDAGFVGSRYDFAAMVFETSGAVNSEGADIIRQLIRFASKRECVGNSSFAGPGLALPVAFKHL